MIAVISEKRELNNLQANLDNRAEIQKKIMNANEEKKNSFKQ